MKPKFFFHKMREVAAFLHIVKAKATNNDQERVKGASDALNAMDDERKVYLEEMEEAIKGQGKTVKGGSSKDKVIRESGGDQPRDISAI